MEDGIVGQADEESTNPQLIPESPESESGQAGQESPTEPDAENSEEFDEVEYEGKRYSVPKELKDAFLRQSDYTRKTQEVAEQRKAVEAQYEQMRQQYESERANLAEHAQLLNVEQQLKHYANIDWIAFSDQDPVAAQKAWFQFQQMQQVRGTIVNQISQREQQRQFDQKQSNAKLIEEGQKVLSREIKGWSQDMANTLTSYAAESGIPDELIRGITHPKVVVALNKAYLYDQIMKQASKPASEPSKPATPVTKIGQKAQASKDPDKMTTEEWMQWRESQLRRKA